MKHYLILEINYQFNFSASHEKRKKKQERDLSFDKTILILIFQIDSISIIGILFKMLK